MACFITLLQNNWKLKLEITNAHQDTPVDKRLTGRITDRNVLHVNEKLSREFFVERVNIRLKNSRNSSLSETVILLYSFIILNLETRVIYTLNPNYSFKYIKYRLYVLIWHI